MTLVNNGKLNTERQEGVKQVGQGFHLLSLGRNEDATRLSQDLLKKYPEDPAVLFFASEVSVINMENDKALNLIDNAISGAPKNANLFMQKARILMILHRQQDACRVVSNVAELSPKDKNMLRSAGQLVSQSGDFSGAQILFEKALVLDPIDQGILFDLATSHFFLGDMMAAEKKLDQIISLAPENGKAVHLRSILRKQTTDQNHIEQLKARMASGLKNWEDNMYFNFALAKEYEDLEEYGKSFVPLKEGAKIRRQHLNYNAGDERNSINDIMMHYTKKVFKDEKSGCIEKGAIFIVGMPRTGTTLVERLLSNHTQVTGAGELSDFPILMTEQVQKTMAKYPGSDMSMVEASLLMDFEELGQNYLKSVRQKVGDSPCFTDKLPFNFQYCGLIKKALPNARIIHLVRDPMDSCYAIYKTLFNQVYSFSYDLEELADYYILYRELMDHWHQAMPGEILDVAYEDVVHDPEVQARRFLQWCDLPWEDSVLDFHSSAVASSTASAAQIRQPIYKSSVQKWRHFEGYLAVLQDKLFTAGLIKEDGTAI